MTFLRNISLLRRKHQDRYPFNIPSVRDLDLELKTPVTFFVGENGAGKSTLLEGIAENCGFNPSGGSRNHVYDFKRTESELASELRLSWDQKVHSGFFMRAESFFNFASYIDELAEEDEGILRAYGGKSLHGQSHGESFLSLFKSRMGKGIYLLDEPEAALSSQRQLSFLTLLKEMEDAGNSQFIIATHSPILLCYPGATIYQFDDSGIREVSFEETEHFQLTRQFLNSPQTFLKHLFLQ